MDVGKDGLLDLDALAKAMRPDTTLVSVMAVNNEIGVIQDIEKIGEMCRERGILFHVDATQAAGKIHSDFERGFIKAEVVNYKDLLEQGSLAAAREKGLVGMEGKDYVVQDGDVILFRFNV